MVSTQGFNALLKLVEEPPAHVKFIFATTEPDKVIGTIRSRTHHYPFRLVPPRVLGDYLAKLCDAEGIHVEPAVLPLVVRAGAGSVRDSLSVLDQLLGGADEHGLAYRQAAALLGYTPDSLLDEFVDAFAAGDAGGVFACVDKVIDVGQDPRRFAEDLLRRLRDLVIVAAVPDALTSGLVDVAADQAERLGSQAAVARGRRADPGRGGDRPRADRDARDHRAPAASGADVRAGAAAGGRRQRAGGARPARPVERRLDMTGAASVRWPRSRRLEGVPTPPPSQVRWPTNPGPGGGGGDDRRCRRTGGHTGSHQPATRAPAEPPRRPARAQVGDRARPTAPTESRSGRSESDDTALGPRRQPPAAGPSGRQPDRHRRTPAVAGGAGGSQGTATVHLDPAQSERPRRGDPDGVLMLAMAGVGARDSFAKGGSQDVLREALIEVLGVDLRIETMVDPSVTSSSRASGSGGSVRGGAQRAAGLADSDAPPPDAEPPEETGGRGGPRGRSRSGAVLQRTAGDGLGPAEWSEMAAVPGAPGPAPEGEGPAGAPADKPSVDPRWRSRRGNTSDPRARGRLRPKAAARTCGTKRPRSTTPTSRTMRSRTPSCWPASSAPRSSARRSTASEPVGGPGVTIRTGTVAP